ncbi:hypothetical protein DFH09DRAFT_1420997 [Mycena vulgaris]|nr:hypothetical protein DFH09DRAFT_1420997 [Mycena vulgaris]
MAPHYGTERASELVVSTLPSSIAPNASSYKLVLILTGINMQAACIAVTTAHAAAETSLAVANTHNTTEVNLVDNGGPTCCHCQWQGGSHASVLPFTHFPPTAPSNNPHILYAAHLRAMDITMHHPSRPDRPSRTCGALNSGMVSGLSLVGERSLRTQQVCQHLQQKAEDALVAEREKVEEKQKALQAGEAEPARQREGISEDLTSATETIKALAARQKQLSTPTLIKATTRFLRRPPPAALNPVLYDTSNPLRLQSRYDFSNARRQSHRSLQAL